MHILIDGLNIRRGGGLTILQRLAHAFAKEGHLTSVLAGEDEITDTFDRSLPIEIHHARGVRSAFDALRFRQGAMRALEQRLAPDGLFTLNYYTPSPIPQATYHVNVIPFLSFMQRLKAVGLPRAVIHAHFARLALQRSQLNLFESNHVFELARNIGQVRNGLVAYIGTDAPEANVPREPVSDRPELVCVTSGAQHKRNDVVLEAYLAFRDKYPGAELFFIGDAKAIREGFAPHQRALLIPAGGVNFTGYLDRNRLFERLATATCLITASELESFFMVAIEAMRVGCPVVATDISSIRESVGDNALLFPAGDAGAAARQIERVWSGRDAPPSAGLMAWAETFDAERCSDKIVQIVATELAT